MEATEECNVERERERERERLFSLCKAPLDPLVRPLLYVPLMALH